MSSGPGIGGRSKVKKLDFHADEAGSFQAGTGGTISAGVGETIRLAFLAPSGMGPADLDVRVMGSSVILAGIEESSRMAGSHLSIGEGELDAVLTTVGSGRTAVSVGLLDANGAAKETVVFTVEVA